MKRRKDQSDENAMVLPCAAPEYVEEDEDELYELRRQELIDELRRQERIDALNQTLRDIARHQK